MKKNQAIYLIVALVILVVAGYLAITQLLPQSGGASVKEMTVEVVGAIEPSLDIASLDKTMNGGGMTDYAAGFDYKAGLGNKAIFGQ